MTINKILVCASNINYSVIDDSYSNDEFVKLLLHFDDDLTDSAYGHSEIHTFTNFGMTYSDSTSGFSKCGIFNNSYATAPDSNDWNLGSIFTIDFLVNFSSYPTTSPMSIVNQWAVNKRNFYVGLEQDDALSGYRIQFSYSLNGSTTLSIFSDLFDITLNTWYHMAVVRNNSDFYCFINGQLKKHSTISGTFYNPSDVLTIGRHSGQASNYFYGKLDELCISKGVARWTNNFIIPKHPYSI